MKKKRVLILAAKIIITLIAAFTIFNANQKQLQPVTVYTFNKTMEDKSIPLKGKDIKATTIPKSALTPEHIQDKDEIIGKHIDRKVTKGHYVYKDLLVEEEKVDIFDTMDLSKHRKISLPISYEEGFAGNMRRGERIDLAYIGAGETEEGGEFRYSKVFLQNIPIWSLSTEGGLAFKDKSMRTTDEEVFDNETLDDDNGELAIITLAVTLDQYEEIKAREEAGKISFVGRFDESENYETMGYVLGDYEKVFSGKGNAETGRTSVIEDDFDEVLKKDEEKFKNVK